MVSHRDSGSITPPPAPSQTDGKDVLRSTLVDSSVDSSPQDAGLPPEERQRRSLERRLNRATADHAAAQDLMAMLMMLFVGAKQEQPGQEDNLTENTEFVSAFASSLRVDSAQLRETVRQVRSGEVSADQAARRVHSSIQEPSDVTLAAAEATVKKYAAKGHPLLELIVSRESGGNYNLAYDGTAKGHQGNFTNMTVDQVLAWQKHHVASGSKSSAVGKFQIIQTTLASLKEDFAKKGEHIGHQKFDVAMQEKLGQALLDRRGYQQYLAGKIDDTTFMRNLSQEWAALPKDMGGKSFYAGDGLNSAHVNPAVLLVAMRTAKQEHQSTLRQEFAKGGVEQKQSPGNLTTAFKPEKGTDEAAKVAAAVAIGKAQASAAADKSKSPTAPGTTPA